METKRIAAKLSELLGLDVAPVAVTFRPTAPAGVKRVERAGPAGCAYWRSAAEGHVFYTEAADHYNCPIGSHTHGVTLPPARARDLDSVVSIMVSLQYIPMNEIPAIPRCEEPFGVAVYAPLADAPVDPDVVLVRGNARQIMLVAEAARAAGVGHDGPTLGPTRVLHDPRGHAGRAGEHEPRLHREPCLHRPRRWRALLHDPRRRPG